MTSSVLFSFPPEMRRCQLLKLLLFPLNAQQLRLIRGQKLHKLERRRHAKRAFECGKRFEISARSSGVTQEDEGEFFSPTVFNSSVLRTSSIQPSARHSSVSFSSSSSFLTRFFQDSQHPPSPLHPPSPPPELPPPPC